MAKTLLAWHFVGDILRDGQPVPKDGEWLEHVGELMMCESGLHASRNPLHALDYAPGNTLCRVRLGGRIIEGTDKVVTRRRLILWRINTEPVLKAFARWCALQVLPLWNAPDVVMQYLRTGDKNNRYAARAAAFAAMDAARDAGDAARAAARAAAFATRDAAMDAAGSAAFAARAARAAARAAAFATMDAARDARDAQNKQFLKMVKEARNGKTSWVFEEQADE